MHKPCDAICCSSHAVQTQKRSEERQHSGTEEILNGDLDPSPTTGCLSSIVVISYLCIVCNQHCDDSHEHFADAYIGGAPSTPIDKDIADDIVIGPMPHARIPPSGDKQTRAAQIQAAFLCGVINAIITIPVMTSFAAIIFQVSPTQPYHACESLKYHVGSLLLCQQQQAACCPTARVRAGSRHLAEAD